MKSIRASLPAVFAFLLVMGFAAAMPTAAFDPDPEVTPVVTESPEPEETESPEPEETESPEPEETESPEPEETEDPDGPESEVREDNHGLAVSTAAKCPVGGRAHGELVRSVAQDKSATVESATAACEAALAAEADTATTSAQVPSAPQGPPNSHAGPPGGGRGVRRTMPDPKKRTS